MAHTLRTAHYDTHAHTVLRTYVEVSRQLLPEASGVGGARKHDRPHLCDVSSGSHWW